MTNTALGAGAEKAQEIIFISEAHEKFYYEKLKEVRYQDVYHKAAYSARTAHPFQRNGAPFRFKLSKAQQVD